MHSIRYSIVRTVRRYSTTKLQAYDSHCLPKEPSWSIKTLTEESEGKDAQEEITMERLRHLHKLAQLNLPANARQVEELKEDINSIAHFMKQVRKADIPAGTEPLVSLWQDQISQTLRPDVPTYTKDEVRGRKLLKHAKKTSGHFYVAKSNIALTEQ